MFCITEQINLLTEKFVKQVKGSHDVEIALLVFMFCCLFLRALLLVAYLYRKLSRKAKPATKPTKIYCVTRGEGQKISMLVVGFLPDGYGMLLGGASFQLTDTGVTKVFGITNLGFTYVKKMEIIFPSFFAKYEERFSKRCVLLRPSGHMLKDSPECEVLMLPGHEVVSNVPLLPVTPDIPELFVPPIVKQHQLAIQAKDDEPNENQKPKDNEPLLPVTPVEPKLFVSPVVKQSIRQKDNEPNENQKPKDHEPLHERLGCKAMPALPPIWLTCLASCIIYKIFK